MRYIFRYPYQLAEDAVGLHAGHQFVDKFLGFTIVEIAALEGKSVEKSAGSVPQAACPSQFHHMKFFTERPNFRHRLLCGKLFAQSHHIELVKARQNPQLMVCAEFITLLERVRETG